MTHLSLKKKKTSICPGSNWISHCHIHTCMHTHSNRLRLKLNKHIYDLLASQGSAVKMYDINTDHSVAILERNPMKAHSTKLPIQHARFTRQQIPCTLPKDLCDALYFTASLRMTELIQALPFMRRISLFTILQSQRLDCMLKDVAFALVSATPIYTRAMPSSLLI